MAEWISADEAAQLSGFHVDYIRRLMRQGKIAAEKKGLMWWIDHASLQAHLATMEALGPKKHAFRQAGRPQDPP